MPDNPKTNPSPAAATDENKMAENEMFHTLIIEDVKYKTRLTKKFANRTNYQPKDPNQILAFIPGTIKKIYTAKSKRLKAGDKILDLEAMKMVNSIFAEKNCTIQEIHVKEGEQVPKNFLLVTLK